MNSAQINAINEAKKNGGRALTTAQVKAVGDDAAFEAATAELDRFDSVLGDYREELQNTGNKFSAMSMEELEEGAFDIILTVIPFFNEVVELQEKDERVQSRLDAFRKLTADEAWDIYDVAFDKVVEQNERGEVNIDDRLDMVVAEYVYEELATGVRIPGENDPVE